MPNMKVMLIVGVLAALVFGYFFIRYPRWRWRIAIGGLLAAGLGVFLTWYILFRTNDATYVADKSAAEAQQAQLDDLFDEGGEGTEPAAAVGEGTEPAAAVGEAPAGAKPPAATPAPARPEPEATPELKGGREKKLTPTPAEALGTLPEGVGIAVGAVSPDATFLGLDGEPVTVGALTAERPLLLVFYRGGWCPFCNNQVHEYSKAYARLTALGVGVAFASVDRPDAATVTKAAWDVPFPLLGDPDAAALEAFHVVNTLDEAGYARLKGLGMDVERWSGRHHHKIAVPAIFLLGRDRRVLWAHAAHDYKVRPSVDELVPALAAALHPQARAE